MTVGHHHRHRDKLPRRLRQAGRRVQVGRFTPALSAADHAAGHQRAVGLRQPVGAQRQQGLGKLAALHRHHTAWGTACLQGLATGIEQTGPQVGGAPVQGDQMWVRHGILSSCRAAQRPPAIGGARCPWFFVVLFSLDTGFLNNFFIQLEFTGHEGLELSG